MLWYVQKQCMSKETVTSRFLFPPVNCASLQIASFAFLTPHFVFSRTEVTKLLFYKLFKKIKIKINKCKQATVEFVSFIRSDLFFISLNNSLLGIQIHCICRFHFQGRNPDIFFPNGPPISLSRHVLGNTGKSSGESPSGHVSAPLIKMKNKNDKERTLSPQKWLGQISEMRIARWRSVHVFIVLVVFTLCCHVYS